MGALTRPSSRQAKPQPVEPAKSKPNKLQKKGPRHTRTKSTVEGNAPVIETDDAPSLEKTAWVEPPQSRARPSWANTVSYFTPKHTPSLKTMRPIGQYPTMGDYKSVGLTPPTKSAIKGAIKRAFKLTVRAGDEIGNAIITEASTPMTPVVEEAVTSETLRVKADKGALSGSENVLTVNGTVETGTVEVLVREVDGDDVRGSSLAPFTSEGIGLQAIKSPLSPLETPLDISTHEPSTEPVITVPQKATSPLSTTILDAMEVMETLSPEMNQRVGRDFIASLDSLPAPKSSRYDVAQLKQVVANALSHCAEGDNDEVAVSLVHYWSESLEDEFKLSLIHNMGLKEPDHSLELALQTMLHHSADDAKEWYKAYVSNRRAALTRQDSGSDSSLSSAQSLEMEAQGQTFKTSDIYRDTSGPRLEDLFNSGKTNTAPLKRPKKPCPVNENSFKRRRGWESDPSLEKTLQHKRARLIEATEPDEEVMAKPSSVRPKRGRHAATEQPSTEGPFIGTAGQEVIVQSVEAPSEPAPARLQRGGRGRGRGRGLGRGRLTRSTRFQQVEQAERAGSTESGEPAEQEPKSAPTSAPAQVLGKRRREWSLDTTVSAESELSNECYSERENDWHGEFNRRQMPNSIEPPDNSDNCYECDQVGELLCCDTCENAFHFECLRPAVDPENPPQGEWYCPRCGVRNSLTTAIAHGRHKKRKTEYSPPTEIKEYFVGVGEAEVTLSNLPKDVRNHRTYKRVPHIPRLTKPAKMGTEAPYNDTNLLKMMENGHAILCDGCGRCSDNVRPIIRCDYCPSRFHLDCLDPPLADVPRPYRGWMCPRHVRPDEAIVTKMVDGRLQERRVRRPKHTVASIDIEPIPYDDVNETTFDDDFRERRHMLPAGDIVLDFISAVRQRTARQNKEFFAGITETCLNLTRSLVEERLAQTNTASATEVMASITPQITEVVENLHTGKSSKEDYDAALSLVGLSKDE